MSCSEKACFSLWLHRIEGCAKSTGTFWILQENYEEQKNKNWSTMSPPLMVLLISLFLTLTGQEQAPSQGVSQTPPRFAGCVSPDLETFRCRWNLGTFQNTSGPDVKLFYFNENKSAKEWLECPHYSTDRGDECYFDRAHTIVWTAYNIQLRSADSDQVYDKLTFNVEDIVQPDPPVGLNWTLLRVSGLTGSHFDIMVSWQPPLSVDVKLGWITLQYEVQYHQVNSPQWSTLDLDKGTHRSVFGLQANVDHEVRVRCKMLSSPNFGAFSEPILVHIPLKEPRFPVAVLLIFAALSLVGILMLILVSKQQKLMVILLPPVPGPKIRGIDPELLKKGKLPELTSILGGPLDLRPELYSSDPWVEFIELDMEEPPEGESDVRTLVTRSPSSSDCPPLSFGFRDDDSGRASCCDPDLPYPDLSPVHPFLSGPGQEPSCPYTVSEPASPGLPPTTAPFPGPGVCRDGLYTQVSEVRNSREVLLAPEEQRGADVVSINKTEEGEEEKKKEKKELKAVAVNTEVGGYTSELDPGRMSGRPAVEEEEEEEEEAVPPASPEWSCGPGLEYYSPASMPSLLSAPSYTMVEAVDRQNSLLLKTAPQPTITKAIPAPEGYLTPDLLGSITP